MLVGVWWENNEFLGVKVVNLRDTFHTSKNDETETPLGEYIIFIKKNNVGELSDCKATCGQRSAMVLSVATDVDSEYMEIT